MHDQLDPCLKTRPNLQFKSNVSAILLLGKKTELPLLVYAE